MTINGNLRLIIFSVSKEEGKLVQRKMRIIIIIITLTVLIKKSIDNVVNNKNEKKSKIWRAIKQENN